MKSLFIFFFIVELLFSRANCIMYGRFISIKEAPYFVSLMDEYRKFICGGAIISERWVITAAHCYDNSNPQRVITGNSIYGGLNGSTHDIEKVFVYGTYEDVSSGLYDDIALIKLKAPIKFNENQQPVKISRIPPKDGDVLVISGFGVQGDAKGQPPVLRQTEVNVIDVTKIDFDIKLSSIREDIFYAGNGTTDACPGDSGGPAIINGQLAGVVSAGPECTMYAQNSHEEGDYTRLYRFYDWIMNITGIVYY